MTNVYVLQYAPTREDGDENVKFIGVYSSKEKAQAAVARLGLLPGFSDGPDGFHIDEYRIDQDHWAEGYVTVADAFLRSASESA